MRPDAGPDPLRTGSFNPRICKRCDTFSFGSTIRHVVSIHASVKDATQTLGIIPNVVTVSIHASVKDATRYSATTASIMEVSIHASVKDATRYTVRSCKPK